MRRPDVSHAAADPEGPKRLEKLQGLGRLVALLGPYRLRVALGTLALCVGSGVSLLYPQVARYAVDEGMQQRALAMLDQLLAGFLLLVVVQAGLLWARHYLLSWVGRRVVTDLRTRVYAHLLGLTSGWYASRRSGAIVGRLASDVSIVEGVVGAELGFALRNALQLVGGIVLLFTVDARLTLTSLVIVPPVVLAAVLFGRVIRRKASRIQDHLADASAQVQDTVGAIQTVQAFRREPLEVDRYASGVEQAFEEGVSLARWRATFFSSVTSAGYLAMALLLWVGSRRVVSGELSAGGLVAFLLYTLTVSSALGSLANLWGTLQRAGGATLRLFEILDTAPMLNDPPHPEDLPDGGGALHFDDVTFAYLGTAERPALRGVQLKVEPGQVVALVGPSGGGKTTLTALALRFYDPTTGSVRFEGVDVRRLRMRELRQHMAIVSQEPVLFYGSVYENIAYGRPEALEAEVRAAARDANASEFIDALPQGYDTLIGERGLKLSGGQRQRIAIARAMLCNPRLLILDEATSSLDAENEALVQVALARLMHGRTTLVIAHRLSTVANADRIIVLEQGRVSERGTHRELMRLSGTYRRLVEHQLVEQDGAPRGRDHDPTH